MPEGASDRLVWLRDWFSRHIRPRSSHFRQEIINVFDEPRGRSIEFIEAFEISEYAQRPDEELRRELFPGGRWKAQT